MSTISAIGAGVVGAVLTVAGIVTVETRPQPESAIIICEDTYRPSRGFLQEEAAGRMGGLFA